MNNIVLGFQVMGYGLVGVFTVLIFFYFVVKLLVFLFPYEKKIIPGYVGKHPRIHRFLCLIGLKK